MNSGVSSSISGVVVLVLKRISSLKHCFGLGILICATSTVSP